MKLPNRFRHPVLSNFVVIRDDGCGIVYGLRQYDPVEGILMDEGQGLDRFAILRHDWQNFYSGAFAQRRYFGDCLGKIQLSKADLDRHLPKGRDADCQIIVTKRLSGFCRQFVTLKERPDQYACIKQYHV